MTSKSFDGVSGLFNLAVIVLAAIFLLQVGPPQFGRSVANSEILEGGMTSVDCSASEQSLPTDLQAYREIATACLLSLPDDQVALDGDVLVMLHRLNEVREEAGLTPLQWHEGAARVARVHAVDMMQRGYFAHRSPEGLGVNDRIQRIDMKGLAGMAGENLAWYRDGFPAQYNRLTLQQQLEDSPKHFEAMITPDFTHVGASIVRSGSTYIAVQVFVQDLGRLPNAWPEGVLSAGETLPLPVELRGKRVGGYRFMDSSGKFVGTGYTTQATVPDSGDINGPIQVIILAEESRSSYLMVNGPLFIVEE